MVMPLTSGRAGNTACVGIACAAADVDTAVATMKLLCYELMEVGGPGASPLVLPAFRAASDQLILAMAGRMEEVNGRLLNAVFLPTIPNLNPKPACAQGMCMFTLCVSCVLLCVDVPWLNSLHLLCVSAACFTLDQAGSIL